MFRFWVHITRRTCQD